MRKQILKLGPTTLDWSQWTKWSDLKRDGRLKRNGHITFPPASSGVYTVRRKSTKELIDIGKASDLRMRVKQGLVKGKAEHSAGKRMRKKEKKSDLEVQWAETDRPSATEEALHLKFKKKYGRLPTYVKHT